MTEPCGPVPLTGGRSKGAEPEHFNGAALVGGGGGLGEKVGDTEGDGDAEGEGAIDGADLVNVLCGGTVDEHPASANPASSTAGKLHRLKD